MAEAKLHRYRSHTCGALRKSDVGANVRLSGWVHRVRDHGGVLFIDLRDHYGLTQVVADPDSAAFKAAELLRSEWVVRIDGKSARPAGGDDQRRASDRRDRALRQRDRSAFGGEGVARSGLRRTGISRRPAPAVSFPRSASRDAACHHHEAARDHACHPAAHARRRLQRISDADPDRFEPRRRARFPRAEPNSSRASSTPCRRRRSSTSNC